MTTSQISDPQTQTPLSDMLCFALYSATHAMQATYKPLLDDLGLTYPQYLVLVSLWGQDDQTVGQLGIALHLESNTLTPLLKRMENAGLLTRLRDSFDERQVRVRIAAKGRALRSQSQRLTDCIIGQSGLTLAAITDLQVRITALRDHLRQP
jgi:MarR family transcriptional regulator, organic hydroperoxide resistance regulator